MRASFLLVLALALLVGLGVAVAVKGLGLLAPPPVTIQNAVAPPPPPPPAGPSVLVATRNLYTGDTIRAGDVRVRPARNGEVKVVEGNPANYLYPTVEPALYRFVANDIEADTPLKKTDILPLGKPDPVNVRLAAGTRAVNVATPRESSAGGLVQTGDWVDVYLTTDVGRTDDGSRTTHTALIAKNAQVIVKRDTLWQSFGTQQDSKTIAHTIATNPYRAAVIDYARTVGTVSIVPVSATEKKLLDDKKKAVGDDTAKGLALTITGGTDSPEYKSEEQRVKDYERGLVSIGGDDLIRLLNLPPIAPPASPTTVEIFNGVNKVATPTFAPAGGVVKAGHYVFLPPLPKDAAAANRAVPIVAPQPKQRPPPATHGSPPMSVTAYQKLRADVHRTVVESIDLSRLERWKPERVRSEIQSLAADEVRRQDVRLAPIEVEQLTSQVMDEVFALGPITGLLADPDVTEVLVNGPKSVFVERDGKLTLTDVTFTDDTHLVRVIQRIAAKVGRRIDESSPMVDARLDDGSRVNALLPPLAADGPVLSIRKFGHVLSHEALLGRESLTAEMIGFLKAAVRAKVNVLISGGTGAGKTTLLNILAGFIPESERIVTIEDTLELKLPHTHVVRTETRPANLEGNGAITQRELLRNSLRMRPDRIIIGEVRGAETLDMLQAMNTGHEGSLTTVHANGPKDALHRVEIMARIAGFDVPPETLRSYIANAIQLIVHVARLEGGERKVVSISELSGVGKSGRYRLREIFGHTQTGVDDGRAVGTFRSTGVKPKLLARLKAAGVPIPADLFRGRDLQTAGDLDLLGS